MSRILIVEDEELVLMLAESVLQDGGHETVTAKTLAEAQAAIHSGEKIDLVFTDIALANEKHGGIAVGLLANQTRIPVLYTSGYATDDVKTQFVEPRAFLRKPYGVTQLLDAADNLLQS